LDKIIKELKHTIACFGKPNQFQAGRIFEAKKILELIGTESNMKKDINKIRGHRVW